MSVVPIVRFCKDNQPEFFMELRKRVAAHFADNDISKYANLNMKLKTIFMFGLYFLPLLIGE